MGFTAITSVILGKSFITGFFTEFYDMLHTAAEDGVGPMLRLASSWEL